MLRWSAFKKEDFALFYAMARVDFLTEYAITHVCTDHNTLTFIFDPMHKQQTMPTHLVAMIQGWALILSPFEYYISHVPGEFDYFSDLLTR